MRKSQLNGTPQSDLALYPIHVNIRGKKCVVIGGGKVATRKVSRLLECAAEVHVVAPWLSGNLEQMVRRGMVAHVHRAYQKRDLTGSTLIVAATDNPDVNRRIARDANAQSILVNVVDQPTLCTFMVPSMLRRGGLVISIGTTGASPTLSRVIRLTLEKQFGPTYGDLVKKLRNSRNRHGTP